MALVHDQQEVGREVVDQGPRPAALLAPGQVAAVVLDAGAVADLAHHLEVEVGALLEARRLQVTPLAGEPGDPLLHLGLDLRDRRQQLVPRRDVVGGGVEVHLAPLGEHLAGERVDLDDLLHLVAEHVHPDQVLAVRWLDLEHVAAHPEAGARHGRVIALVLQVDQVAQDPVAAIVPADLEVDHRRAVVDRRPEAVDARHRGDDDHVASLEEGAGGVVAQPVDLVVAGRVLLDVGIRPGQVGLRLEVVVVADEVLDRVIGEELAELLVELRGQGLVVRHHQGRLADRLDHLGRSERLARSGGAQQDLVLQPALHPVDQRPDGGRLIAGRLEWRVDLEFGHAGGGLVAENGGRRDEF